MPLDLALPPEAAVELVQDEYDQLISWTKATLSDAHPSDSATNPTPEPLDYACTPWNVEEPVTLPPLRGGPQRATVRRMLAQISPDQPGLEYLDQFIDLMRTEFTHRWREGMIKWAVNVLHPKVQHRYPGLSKVARATTFATLLKTNTDRYMDYGTRYFTEWARSVRTAVTERSDEGGLAQPAFQLGADGRSVRQRLWALNSFTRRANEPVVEYVHRLDVT